MKSESAFHPRVILCPVNFSELSDLALKYAAAGARAFDAELVVLHATRFELPAYFTRAQSESLLRELRAQLAAAEDFLRRHVGNVLGPDIDAIGVRFEVADAPPVEAILEAGQKHHVDLIVMGTHGRGDAKRLWLGSVAEHLVHRSEVPVFAVRQTQHRFIDAGKPLAAPALRTILCPVNFTAPVRAALNHAAALARRFGAQLIAACVIEPGMQRDATRAHRELAEWLEELGVRECPVRAVTRKGRAAEEIVALAAESRADLVVLGAARERTLRTWIWGDTVEQVLRLAPAPVLVVPH